MGLFALIFLFGCIQSGSSSDSTVGKLCSDGETIVTDLNDCPKIDADLKECEEASATSSYGASDRDVCYYDLALVRENITLCRKIRNTDSWYEPTSAQCGADLAIYAGNVSLCGQLSLTSKYDCYEIVAEELEDPTICEYIESSSKKDDCLYNYVSYNYYYIDDWSLCDSFSGKGYEGNYCYSKAAEYTGDEKYCDKIVKSGSGFYSYSKASCYATVAKDDGTPALCGTLSTDEDKDDCYYDYATSYPYEVEVCNKISDSYRKSSCVDWANYSYY